MVSDEARREIDKMFAEKKSGDDRPLAQQRREWEQEALQDVLPRGARFSATVAGGVAGEWMDMPHVSQERIFLLLHGGGYNAGSPKTHRKLAANIARATNMRVLVPDYRLAPEHPFPAGVKDALLAFGWLLSQGRKESDIVIGGDSAGGGLALSMLLALREAGLWYAGKRDPADPLLSPIFADPSGLPPLLIHAGGDEVMLDDSRIFAQQAKEAGVPVSYKSFPGMWHVFHTACVDVPESRQAIDEIGDFVRELYNP